MMDYKELSEFFGGSIFPEEHRGDFAAISERIDALSSSTTSEHPVNERANALLLKGIFGLLTGNLMAAEQHIHQISELEQEGLDQLSVLRCQFYKFYVAYIRRLPPVLRFRSSFHNLALEIMDCELQFGQRLVYTQAASQRLRNLQHKFSDAFESIFFTDLYTFGTYLNFAMMLHPTHPPGPMNATILRSLQPVSDAVTNSVAQVGIPTTATYVARLEFEGCHAQRSPASAQRLQQLHEWYDRNDDLVGLGICKIMEGDNILSRPFTSPIALNLIPIAHGPGWNDQAWDPVESAFPLRSNDDADQCYEQALYLMEAAGAPRGQAAVYLRRGCILHAEGIRARSQNPLAASQLFNEAALSFERAQELYHGDGSNTLLVTCHRLLLYISRGEVDQATAKAQEIGRDAYNVGNTGMSQFCGILILRFGRRQFLDYTQVNQGLLCCRCARVCFAESQDHVSELQAMVAHADLSHQSNNTVMAVRKVREIRALGSPLRPALRYLDELATRPDTESTMRAARFNVLSYVDLIFNRIFSAAEDHTLRTSWNEEKVAMRPGGPAFAQDTTTYDTAEETSAEQSSAEHAHGIAEFTSANPEMDFLLKEFERLVYEQQVEGGSDIFQKIKSIDDTRSITDKLVQDYQRCQNESARVLQESDLDKWEQLWRGFLERHDAIPEPQRACLLYFKVIALSQLGAVAECQSLLQSALPRGYAGDGSDSPFDQNRDHVSGDVLSFLRDSATQDAERALSLCFLAQDWAQGSKCLTTASRKVPGYLVRENMSEEPGTWHLITYIAAIYEHNWKVEESFGWYLAAANRLETLRQNISDLDARVGTHSRIQSGELYTGLARVCIAFAKTSSMDILKSPQHWGLPAGGWLEQALLFLEKGRARALLDVMLAGNVDAKAVEKLMERTYQNRQRTTESFEGGGDDVDPDADFDKDQIAIAEILSTNLVSQGPDQLFASIPPDSVVLHISLSRQGLILLCATNHGVESPHCGSITDIEMRKLVLSYLKIVKGCSGPNAPPGSHYSATFARELQAITERISTEIIFPVQDLIRQNQNVILVPSHSLQKFPCSALLLEGKPIFLQKVVYQIPSLSTLVHLQGKARTQESLTTSVLTNSQARGRPVPLTGAQSLAIARLFDGAPVDSEGGSIRELDSIFANSDVVYISTHGEMKSSPMESYIDLGENFRVLDLARLRTRAALVVFSACFSGRGSETVGNDILGYSHAVLQAGARGYIGGLWEVYDWASMVIMVSFFRELKARPTTPIAECWQKAQVILYEMDKDRAKALLEEMLRDWEAAKAEGVRLQGYKETRKALKLAIKDFATSPVDFRFPTVWAPYILVGNGSFAFRDG